MINLSDDDLEWLKREQPQLLHRGNAIRGAISYSMLYDPFSGHYTLNPEGSPRVHEVYHEDTYRISIDLDVHRSYPSVREVSDKILTTQRRIGCAQGDMHINSDGTFCLEALQELEKAFRNAFTLSTYINQYVIPFLFEQTHMRLTGDWAWKPLPHYEAGPLEWYYLKAKKGSIDDGILSLKAIAATGINAGEFYKRLITSQMHRLSPCLCRSGKPAIHCCPRAMYGYKKLRKLFLKTSQTDLTLALKHMNSSAVEATPTPPSL